MNTREALIVTLKHGYSVISFNCGIISSSQNIGSLFEVFIQDGESKLFDRVQDAVDYFLSGSMEERISRTDEEIELELPGPLDAE